MCTNLWYYFLLDPILGRDLPCPSTWCVEHADTVARRQPQIMRNYFWGECTIYIYRSIRSNPYLPPGMVSGPPAVKLLLALFQTIRL